MRRVGGALLAAGLAVVASPRLAEANVGVPMIMLVWPGFWVLLVPIVIVEAVVARRVLEVPWSEAVLLSGRANFVSTLAGVPATWMALLVAEFAATGVLAAWCKITGQEMPLVLVALLAPFWAPWIGPVGPEHDWMIPAAAMWLCGVFFLVSVRLEAWVVRGDGALSPDAVRRWSWQANVLTYSMIEVLLAGLLVWTLVDR